MKKNIVKLFSLIVAIFMIFSFSFVYANNELESQISKTDYSEEYKEWQKLSDEEKENSIMPRKYDIIKSQDNATYLKNLKNIFRMQMLLKGPLMDSYNLKDVIPENTTIRNQMNTNSCWAFASLGALETNLAMRDYNSSKGPVVYDFSEKHMNYATAKSSFLDNKTNEYGFSKEVSEGGNFYMATQYLTNGLGAIDEEDLPFENSEEDIDISEIQNKEVKTTLYDTVEFESVDPSEKEVVMDSMKEHIANYGGIYAGISGASIFGDNYNNETGAMYCSDSSSNPIDHAVTIIGWDDNYSLDNFNENNRPTANGAWIVKNSWGEEITENLLTIKEMLFNEDPSYWEELTYDSPEKIPTDIVVNAYKQIYGESKVEVRGKYKKQSGGHGQFGDVLMSFEPLGDLTKSYEFEEKIFGGSVPKQYFPAVEKGIQECVLNGVLAGYPVVGLKATLLDGSYHPVDSSEMAFKMATSMAFKDGLTRARPTILEPVVHAEVLAPEKYMGYIMGDINKRRGRILKMDPEGKNMRISAEVPEVEMFKYCTDLRSMTQSRGEYTYHFERYEEAPPEVQQEVINKRKAEKQG